MWQLHKEENNRRFYINSVTNSQCSTIKLYTDKEGNNWFGFEDLMTIPYTRQFASTKISSLYALGFSKDDLNAHINGLKAVLKSNDSEKYEKAFALVLDFESKANNATDPIRQLSSLVCVYYLLENEPIDSFQNDLQLRKMSILENDPEAHAFFLQRQMEDTERYMMRLNQISQMSLVPTVEPLGALQ